MQSIQPAVTAGILIKEESMNKKIRTDAVEHMFEAILCLQSKEECYQFFEDLCTAMLGYRSSDHFAVGSWQAFSISGSTVKLSN